jgi:tetratricopeptide (TPR) repeat protein
MQVLVALGRVEGLIVTRDELIERCWDGRIVSDDAINRVLSRIRQLAAGLGGGSFAIETIARVGYRVAATRGVAEQRPAASRATRDEAGISRRRLIRHAGLAGTALGVGGVAWWGMSRRGPNEQAEQLYRRGALLMREGLPGQVRQAVSYFERAVAVDPNYADAWGALALGYSHLFEGFDDAELGSLPQRIRSASERALALDGGNSDARLALVFITPNLRNWAAKEAELRRIVRDHPRHWLAHGRLGVLMYQVGRLSDGIEHNRAAIEIEPMLPISYFFLIKNLSALGRVQEADALIEKAHQQWPAHPALWTARFNHLLFSGRPKAAAAFAQDPDSYPSAFPTSRVQSLLRLAHAVDTGDAAAIAGSVAEARRVTIEDVTATPQTSLVFVLLGDLELTFASLDRYLLDRGPFGAPAAIGPYTRRYTESLFARPMGSARDDPRFARLVGEIGLEEYWRKTGTAPDFRRESPGKG